MGSTRAGLDTVLFLFAGGLIMFLFAGGLDAVFLQYLRGTMLNISVEIIDISVNMNISMIFK